MKTLILISLLICGLNALELHKKKELKFEDFIEWAQVYDKDFNDENYKQKFEIFLQNHRLVRNLNDIYKGKTEFTLNQFADFTPEQFKAKVLMRERPPKQHSSDRYLKTKFVGDLPDRYDWRDRGVVTPVKDQGYVGTCWAFSTIQNIEGQFALKGYPLTNLSVEQVVDCDGTVDTSGDEHSDCGVYGGWPYLAFQYIMRAGGLASDDKYQYCSGFKTPCSPCEAPGYNKTTCGPPIPYCYLKDSCQAKFSPQLFVPNLTVVDWKAISQNETDIAAQLMQIGPLSIALNAEMLQFYHKGIFSPFECDPKKLDHAVLLVGWGKDHSVIWGEEPFWIVKNSWGAKWGESGYFRITRGKGKCGVNTQVATSILN